MSLLDQIDQIRSRFNEQLATVTASKEIAELRLTYFGKKGVLSSLMHLLKDAPKQER